MEEKITLYRNQLAEISKKPNEFGFNSEIRPLCDYLYYFKPCDRDSKLVYEDCKTSIQIQQDLDDIVSLSINEISRLMKHLNFICVQKGNYFVWKMQRIEAPQTTI